jgi:hypothetical protein
VPFQGDDSRSAPRPAGDVWSWITNVAYSPSPVRDADPATLARIRHAAGLRCPRGHGQPSFRSPMWADGLPCPGGRPGQPSLAWRSGRCAGRRGRRRHFCLSSHRRRVREGGRLGVSGSRRLELPPARGAAPLDDDTTAGILSSRKTPAERRADERVVRVRLRRFCAAINARGGIGHALVPAAFPVC